MEELIRFVTLAQTERFTLTELCEQFCISRKTTYKHLERYVAGGFKARSNQRVRPRIVHFALSASVDSFSF